MWQRETHYWPPYGQYACMHGLTSSICCSVWWLQLGRCNVHLRIRVLYFITALFVMAVYHTAREYIYHIPTMTGLPTLIGGFYSTFYSILLYWRVNLEWILQDRVVSNGTMELQKREDEIRVLKWVTKWPGPDIAIAEQAIILYRLAHVTAMQVEICFQICRFIYLPLLHTWSNNRYQNSFSHRKIHVTSRNKW